MEYHPGGWDELMKGAGKEATDLFNEVHRWVNYESMLQACLVGKLDDDGGHANAFKAPKPRALLSPKPGMFAEQRKIFPRSIWIFINTS